MTTKVNAEQPPPATDRVSKDSSLKAALADMNAQPDVSGNDSERLRGFCRMTTIEVKAVGMVSAATSLEMIGYMRELEWKLAAQSSTSDVFNNPERGMSSRNDPKSVGPESESPSKNTGSGACDNFTPMEVRTGVCKHCGVEDYFHGPESESSISSKLAEIKAFQEARHKLHAANRPFDPQTALWNVDTLLSIIDSLQAEVRQEKWNPDRVVAWMDDGNRKPAIHAFTAGGERQIAYRVERLIEQASDSASNMKAELVKRVRELGGDKIHRVDSEYIATELEAVQPDDLSGR